MQLLQKCLDDIEEDGVDNIMGRVKRSESFIKTLGELGFKKASGWNPGFSNRTPAYNLKTSDGKSIVLANITVGNYDHKDETVSFKDESQNSTNKGLMNDVELEDFLEYVTNPRLPFNQEKEKEEEEVNENYTNKIINTIINNIITKNVRK